MELEQTLAILKPSAVERSLVGNIIARIEQKGLIIQGIKMIRFTEDLVREHYAHLVDKPFFPSLAQSMMSSPVIVMCLAGVDAIEVFRTMTGVTNGRKALPGTLRGDFCMSQSVNIIHASDSVDNAKTELARFFRPEEIFDWKPSNFNSYYATDELKG